MGSCFCKKKVRCFLIRIADHVNIKVMCFLGNKCKWFLFATVKVPITPKTFLAGLIIWVLLSKMPQIFLDLVKTPVLYEFSQLRLFSARPSETDTGTIDVNPAYRRQSEVEI